eukprot:scaffold268077_cov32-Tisochrysis_lutea.AAC.2
MKIWVRVGGGEEAGTPLATRFEDSPGAIHTNKQAAFGANLPESTCIHHAGRGAQSASSSSSESSMNSLGPDCCHNSINGNKLPIMVVLVVVHLFLFSVARLLFEAIICHERLLLPVRRVARLRLERDARLFRKLFYPFHPHILW